tara:strand:+ start:2287 stop:2460 length:174 start_codon:yes stop_codon:yes gene_type:complete
MIRSADKRLAALEERAEQTRHSREITMIEFVSPTTGVVGGRMFIQRSNPEMLREESA